MAESNIQEKETESQKEETRQVGLAPTPVLVSNLELLTNCSRDARPSQLNYRRFYRVFGVDHS